MIQIADKNSRIASSFRDPSGFLFRRDSIIYRQINTDYQQHYDWLTKSGLYKILTQEKLLIPHVDANITPEQISTAYKIIQPENIPFISYPYEWCFSQLKSAALATLHIQKIAFQFDMILKDANAFNIQFIRGKPILIDTLSFEKYQVGLPWIAYRQFCQHFLAPIALMAMTDIRLNSLAKIYIDGIPLDLASVLLPKSSWFKFGILSHIHLHAKSQKRFGNKIVKSTNHRISKTALSGIIDSLEATIRKIDWKPEGTEWGSYYEDTNYSSEALNDKKEIIRQYLNEINPKSVWDIGSNTGIFSRLASEKGIPTLSFDIDPAAVEKNHKEVIRNKEESILPLCLDLTNPTPGIGWENQERISLIERGPADTVFVLALIHHLAISNNLPLDKIAIFLSRICQSLIIEFVPKNDSQVQRLLSTREDIFPNYTQEAFEKEFVKYFKIRSFMKIRDSERILYLMQNK